MRYLLTLFILLNSTNLYALGRDKKLHAGISAAMTAGGYSICRLVTTMTKPECILTTAASVLAIGALKEVGDGSNNTVIEHFRDLGADSIGIGAGLLITIPW